MKVYLDNAATTPIYPRVFEKMLPFLKDDFGNPSSIHSFGRKAKVALEKARETIADFINTKPGEIYFVGNGTEANNFAIFGIAKTNFEENNKNKILTTQAEHHSVLEPCNQLKKQNFLIDKISVTSNSGVNIKELLKALDENVSLISIIHVNNETGTINDIENISSILNNEYVYLHTDAVQSFGKIQIDVKRLGVDSLSASAHKIGGPKGVGMLFVKSGTPISPIIFGGSQERNRRGGTENVAGIVGFAEAVKIAEENMKSNFVKIKNLRKYFIDGIKSFNMSGIEINGGNNTIPHVLSITFNNNFYKNDAEAMLMYLDINGIAASNGAACTSGTLKASHVILSTGKPIEDARGTIRFSFSPQNTIREIDYTLDILKRFAAKFSR